MRNYPVCPRLLPEAPPYQDGEDSHAGTVRFERSEAYLPYRLATAIHEAIIFMERDRSVIALQRLRDARDDFLRTAR